MTSLFYSDRLKNKNKYLGRPLPLAAGSSTASTAPWAPAAGGLWPGHRGRRAGDGQGKEAPGRKEVCLRHSWGAPIAVQANCADAALAMNSRQHLPRLGHTQSPPQGLTSRMQHRTQQAGTWPCPAPRCLAAAGGQPHQSHQPQFPTPLPFSTPFYHCLLPLGMTLPCERLPPPHPRPGHTTGKHPRAKPGG